ncbi:Lrp/AsnC family transcriptional regulator [Derxia lacustris]|uniref:Lrp/AsnC family transcriptional regulator n=1 Tax=Derxia lacustris TaxID=764842 RepID=UPI000A17567D|nr:Lrp/AsnC family transcriptional regulator [Derxia lacustris]
MPPIDSPLPAPAGASADPSPSAAPQLPAVALDAIDLRILDLLQDDCALTNQALADLVHVSPPTCLRRVRRLVEAGVIERRVALLSAEKLGAGLTAILEVTLDRQTPEAWAAFEARVADEAAVQQCYRVTTGPDFVLIVQLTDMAAYHALVHAVFTAEANVRNLRSFFSVRRSKFEPRLALGRLP